MLDQLAGSMHPGHGYSHAPAPMRPSHPQLGIPRDGSGSGSGGMARSHPPGMLQPIQPPPPSAHLHGHGVQLPPSAQISARTSDGSGSNNNPSPVSNQGHSARVGHSQAAQQMGPPPAQLQQQQPQYGAPMEPTASATSGGDMRHQPHQLQQQQQQPTFAETPAWLTENATVPMPIYHRKSSDGQTLRFMMEVLSSQGELAGSAGNAQGQMAGQGADGRFTNTQDPLDTTPRANGAGAQGQGQGHAPGQGQGNLQVNYPIVQSSPFGTLLIPAESGMHPNALAGGPGGDVFGGQGQGSGASLQEIPTSADLGTAGMNAATAASVNGSADNEPPTFGQRPNTDAQGNTVRMRRSTLVKPSWNKTPRILVVEDDVVYRQLSSKFLEKFGCVVETVVNASEAIEKMNSTKYDLVLMDIFFGPSMDG